MPGASRREGVMIDAERLNRIRWRCRRGMLENDLVLTRFLDQRGAAIAEAEVVMLDRLLDLPDTELWDLLSGRAEPQDVGVVPLLQHLRTA
jgi:antitoxin CptB